MTRTVDRRPDTNKPCCIRCATWVCHECWDWHRKGADRNSHQICTNCGGIEGEFVAMRHQALNYHYPRIVVPQAVPQRLPRSRDEMLRLLFFSNGFFY